MPNYRAFKGFSGSRLYGVNRDLNVDLLKSRSHKDTSVKGCQILMNCDIKTPKGPLEYLSMF